MKIVLLLLGLAMAASAASLPSSVSRKETTALDILNIIQDIAGKFTQIYAAGSGPLSDKNLSGLADKLRLVLGILEEIYPAKNIAKKDNLVDKMSDIQDLLDGFVASIENGEPLPPEVAALGADEDPHNFLVQVLLMAAGNLSKRDLVSVARVI